MAGCFELKIGDQVAVELPGGIYQGEIRKIHKNHGLISKETRYEIHGKNLLTVTSDRFITKLKPAL